MVPSELVPLQNQNSDISLLMILQYTKIFTGPRSLKPLIVAVLIGIPLGQLLRHFSPNFVYSNVTALAVATVSTHYCMTYWIFVLF